ncbi:MAG: hypothetical protein NTW60_00370 [Candidatus Wolfebacteria bacterium]|nr:hypothetical protein [Candidatus Wolfebacteria bacterium]
MEKIEDSGGLKDKKEPEESQVFPMNVDMEAFMKWRRDNHGGIKKEISDTNKPQIELTPRKPVGKLSEKWALEEVKLFTKEEKAENLRMAQKIQVGESIAPTIGSLTGFVGKVVEINLREGIILIEFGNYCYWEPAKYLEER